MKHWMKIFQKPDRRTEARLELEEAQLELLAAQTQLDYTRSMVGFQKARTRRLKKYLAEEE